VKSPIKGNPLRNPAESLDEEIDVLVNEEAGTYIFIAAMTVLLTFLEWWRSYFEAPVSPITYSVIASIVLPYCVFKVLQLKKKLKYLRQGRDGEKVVGQYLELLRESGAKIFHDIPGDGFNLDHVVISNSGIYVIETKTYSKPENGSARMIFDGSSISFGGVMNNDKPIIQVKAASHWLSELLKNSTGSSHPIKPVVVFPGWFIEPTSEARNSDVWVLNPKALPTFISNSKEQMTHENIHMVAFHLSRYIRNYSR